jgi:hypothetical protein
MKASYQPPTALEISESQNSESNLKLLLAQRRIYSSSKIWSNIRYTGVFIIAVCAPMLAAYDSHLAVPTATVASIWYVLNIALFKYLERRGAIRGAIIQEQFDLNVFGMPPIASREPRILPEDMAFLNKPTKRRMFATEKLRDWYPVQTDSPGRVAIAISQRANAAYTRRLLLWYASLWVTVLIVWAFIAIGIGLVKGFSLATFLLAVVIPILPPLVDAWEEFTVVRSASREREALANEIYDAITTDASDQILPENLLAWQSQLFALRRDAPLVPDWLYSLLRERNEREMLAAAKAISSKLHKE